MAIEPRTHIDVIQERASVAATASAVHNAMVAGDTPRPPAAQIAARRLGFDDAFEQVSPDVAQKKVIRRAIS